MLLNEILDSASTKLQDQHPNLHRWKNWEPNTPFAPLFDVPLWVEDLDASFVELLIDEIKANDIQPYGDAWRSYNIFSWRTKSVNFLRKQITRAYINYINALSYPQEGINTLWIRGWGVILDPGQHLNIHSHSYHENTFISGNLMLSDNKTTTDYYLPHLSPYYGPWRCENKPGRITLFPSWVLHGVKQTEDRRISVGFDLYTSHTMQYISDNRIVGDIHQESILKSIKLV